MRIFAIKDESISNDKILAYLIYYENKKEFYIELPEDSDSWETPLLLSSFVDRNQFSVNSYCSKLWVSQRIIPPDRQNIGSILKKTGLISTMNSLFCSYHKEDVHKMTVI